MPQELIDFFLNASHPVLIRLFYLGLALSFIGFLPLLLSWGVHFAGFRPPDPEKFPTTSAYLRRIAYALIGIGIPLTVVTFLGWWPASPAESLSEFSTTAQAKLEKLSEKIQTLEQKIAALEQELALQKKHRQKLESQISEQETELQRRRQELMESKEALNSEDAGRIAELSQRAESVTKELDLQTQEYAELNEETNKLRKQNEGLQADLNEQIQLVTKLRNDLEKLNNENRTIEDTEQISDDLNDMPKLFDDIEENVGDYVGILLYKNPNDYFYSSKVLGHISYAISGDVSLLRLDTIGMSRTAQRARSVLGKIEEMLGTFKELGYVNSRRMLGKYLESTFNYYEYYASSKGRRFFNRILEKYQSDPEKKDFLKRLNTEAAPALQGTVPKSGQNRRDSP